MIDALRKITSPSVANAIETFNVRPRNQGNMSSEIRTLFPEMGPLVGYAVTAVIRAEPQPLEGHRASTFGWWDYVLSIPAQAALQADPARDLLRIPAESIRLRVDSEFRYPGRAGGALRQAPPASSS
jgi:hypothetical protein